MESRFKGTGVALVTPFNADKSIDYTGLERVIEHLSEGGIDYLLVSGTTGEAPTTTEREKLDVLKFVKANQSKKLPIVFGIGGNDTAETVEKYNAFEEEVDAFLCTAPYYNRPAQDGIQKHYELVADAAPKPIFIYNVPSRTARNVEAATTLALAQHPNIIGTKEASGNLGQCIQIAAGKPGGFLLLSGDDALAVPMISIGAEGLISVAANALPKQTSAMVRAALNGNFDEAAKLAHQLIEPINYCFEQGSPSGIKYIMSQLGLCRADVRLPLVPLTTNLKAKIDTMISEKAL